MLLLDSTVGQKVITAATGLGLVGFVVGHLLGNLQMFLGPEAINVYAYKLKSLGLLLWVSRIGLLGLIALHIAMTVRLAIRNHRASPVRNRHVVPRASTRSSRYRIVSGTVILEFVIFHLLHFMIGGIQPSFAELEDSAGRYDVYTVAVRGFENWAIAGFYIGAHADANVALDARDLQLLANTGDMIKSARPQKLCPACGRLFSWRKKWERDWASVIYCSSRCRASKEFRMLSLSIREKRRDL